MKQVISNLEGITWVRKEVRDKCIQISLTDCYLIQRPTDNLVKQPMFATLREVGGFIYGTE